MLFWVDRIAMKTFDELTQRGQSARLLGVARAALHAYPIDVKRVRLLAKHTNTLFRVDAMDGTRYVLRVCTPGNHSPHDNQIEALWLEALAGAPEIRAPYLVAGCDGQTIRQVVTDSVTDGRRCMLFTWVPGKRMPYDAPAKDFEKVGVLLAQLHRQSATMSVPEHMRPMRWDKAFYFPHDPVVVYDPAKVQPCPSGWMEMIGQAEHIVNAELDRLFDCGRPQLIHGDMHANNVHVYKGDIYAIDFEDVVWGFPVQDIAVTLYAARYHRDPSTNLGQAFADVRDALRRGYERVAAWPVESDRQLETLLVARMLMFINYRVHRGGVDMGKYLPGMLARVEAFVNSEPSRSTCACHCPATEVAG